MIASVYEREIRASLDSVWENVFDWEHLPWLHSQAFDSIELRDSGDWGWQADLGFPGGGRAELELVVDRPANHYVARTLDGAGSPGEIWTRLEPVESGRTRIRVEFCVLPLPEGDLDRIGTAYVALYTGLWDQDEEMMQVRERAFAGRGKSATSDCERLPAESSHADSDTVSNDLGAWTELAPRLPLLIEFGGHRFRLVELGGRPVAHSVECPHWLGPLAECPIDDGVVICPWHGYGFDVETGRSTQGRSLRLRPAPRVELDTQTGRVRIFRDPAGEKPAGV